MPTKNHDLLTAEVKDHIAADAVIQGKYWDGKKGCFIGCLAHSSDAAVLQDRFGLPLPLVKICESIFERLSADDAKSFFAAIPAAVGCDGKDLSRVHWKFLAAELLALPDVPADIQAVIDLVIGGMDLLASGKEWPDAAAARAAADAAAARAAADARVAAADARVAAAAAYAAAAAADYAADYAAADYAAAAYAAAYAAYAAANYAADYAAADYAVARAAYAAAAAAVTNRQRDTLLRLISEAPMEANQ